MNFVPVRTRTRSRIAIAGLAVCAAGSSAPQRASAAPVTIHGEDPVFSAVIPDGFTEMSGTRDGVFVFGRRRDGRAPTVITLRPLRSTIANLPIDEHAARDEIRRVVPEAEVSLDRARAMDLDVPLVVTRMPRDQIVISATLPSSPRAIELSVTGDAAEEATVRQATRAVMNSFESNTNWLTTAQVTRRNCARWAIGLAWALLIAFGLAWVVRFRRRPGADLRTQATWLAVSAAAFLSSAALLASVPPGTSAFGPVMPLLVGVVVLVNAVIVWRSSSVTGAAPAA